MLTIYNKAERETEIYVVKIYSFAFCMKDNQFLV